jgi:hypothetical protein
VRHFLILFALILLTIQLSVQAQDKDSAEKKSFTKKAFTQGIKFISTSTEDTILNEKSVDAYTAYAGKIIRHIFIERIGFEKSIYDSAKKVRNSVTQVANFLHVDTRENTIRQHLFVDKNKPLNPFELADNERFLRDKDFILDCRIVVTVIEGTDSVDLTVVTRDVFSLSASLGGSFPSAPKIGVSDANVAGRGQRIELTSLIDQGRTSKIGYSTLFRKSSIFGSLTNLEFRYTQLDDGLSFGDEKEFATLVRLDRPLVSPYSRLAGGGEISNNWSQNVSNKPDSIFLKYQYTVLDGWLGYNIGIKKEFENRKRKFIALRLFNGSYVDQPDQDLYKEQRKYNSISGYLSEFTLYRQNFYKTRYVFGFGRTEDVPNGFSFGVTGGYVNQLRIERPYGALKVNYGNARKKGDFIRLQTQLGGYWRGGKMEDVILQGGASYFSRLFQLNRFKSRNLFSATYTQLVNHTVIDWLEINSQAIPGFRSDSLKASSRLALHAESALFTPWSLIGFRFAPFTAIDMVAVNCVECLTTNNLYWGFSGGLRTRNENLIFGTIELKFTYLPNDQYGNSKFVFGFRQNLQIKNTGSFVRAPSFILYN